MQMLFSKIIDNNKPLQKSIWAVNISALLFFSMFLSVKGAHSWAMGFVLLASVLTWRVWMPLPKAQETRVLSAFLLILALWWSHSFDGWLSWSTEGDFFIKYALGAFCALSIATLGVNPRVLMTSLALGSISSGVLAILQFPEMGRVSGYTNAIKFGDIAIYMALACWILAAAKILRLGERVFLVLAGSMGLMASLLSLSRGGWILLVVFPVLALFFVPRFRHRIRWLCALCLLLIFMAFGFGKVPAFEARIEQVKQELTGYLQSPADYVGTSVGARLEQWRLSWAMGRDKPLTGWGQKGSLAGKEQFIAQGDFHPFLREINHSHNDFLDMWVKRGIFGVGMLVFIYAVPIWIFYPTRKRTESVKSSEQPLFVAFSLVGVMLPVGYFVFGWTDVFFNITIGHNFYIFSLIFILSGLNWLRKYRGATHEKNNVSGVGLAT